MAALIKTTKNAEKNGKQIEMTWSQDKMRAEFSKLISAYKIGIWSALVKEPEQLRRVMLSIMSMYAAQLKAAGVGTPQELVSYMGELIVNLTGGEVRVFENERGGTLVYESHPLWEQMKQLPQVQELLAEEKRPAMESLYAEILGYFAKEFQFEADFKLPMTRPLAEISFRSAGP